MEIVRTRLLQTRFVEAGATLLRARANGTNEVFAVVERRVPRSNLVFVSEVKVDVFVVPRQRVAPELLLLKAPRA